MATSVRCILCLDNDDTNDKFNIRSNIIPKSDIEDMQLLGSEMVKHMQAHHPEQLEKVAILALHWNGFNVMKFFETEKDDSKFNTELETMRDQLIEEVMFGAPEDEEEEEFEDEDDEDDCENDLTEDDDDDNDEILEMPM